ncbi:MAG: radical SAM protein, partial [Candidatus Micrarchaeia archaeon]
MSRYRVFAGRNPRVVSIKEWQPLKRFEPKVEGISLLPTTRCTAYCAHCFICANDNAATMEREMLMDVIEQIRDIPTINSFLWNGGECTLCFEGMVKGTRLIKERYPHIVVSMLSNGWFGNKDPEKIIGKLADAGIDSA